MSSEHLLGFNLDCIRLPRCCLSWFPSNCLGQHPLPVSQRVRLWDTGAQCAAILDGWSFLRELPTLQGPLGSLSPKVVLLLGSKGLPPLRHRYLCSLCHNAFPFLEGW